MKRNVLVIDDNDDVRFILSRRLSDAGFEVTAVPDGFEGLAELRRRRPWCVLVDLKMPKMDGFEFLAAAQRDEATVSPIFVVSQLDDAETCERVRQLGARKLFSKSQALQRSFAATLESIVACHTAAPHTDAFPRQFTESVPAAA